jgi:antitoxin MazE
MAVQTKIQKWGNGLGLRVSGILRVLPHFEDGTKVNIDVTEQGFTVTRLKEESLTEKQLIDSLSADNEYTDLVARPLTHETGE